MIFVYQKITYAMKFFGHVKHLEVIGILRNTKIDNFYQGLTAFALKNLLFVALCRFFLSFIRNFRCLLILRAENVNRLGNTNVSTYLSCYFYCEFR